MWTVQIKYKHKKVKKYKVLITSPFFLSTDFRFGMEVHIDCLTKLPSTKSTKGSKSTLRTKINKTGASVISLCELVKLLIRTPNMFWVEHLHALFTNHTLTYIT